MKSRIIYLLTILVLLFIEVAGQQNSMMDHVAVPAESYRIHPSQVTQTEVFMVNSPVDENVLFASCNTLTFSPFFVSEGIYVTTNGGESWQGNDTCSGEPIAYHGGDPGIVIDKNGTFVLTRLGRAPLTGLYSHRSTDNGLTWTAAQVISTDDLERASLESDIFSESAFYGRTYAAWVKFAQPFPVVLSYSDNAGESWSTPTAINSPANRSAGGDLTIGPNGEVYTCWAGVTDTSPFKEILVGFAKSTDGGENWAVTENAFPMNGITGVLADKGNIRVNGLPAIAVDSTSGPYKGRIYIVTGQKELSPAGNDPDIVLYRSLNDGQSWSPGIRVNQDALNNGKTQYFPSIRIDKFGAVNVIFYDDRNTSIDSTGVYLARSKDGGDNWEEYRISDHHFKPQPIGGLGQGYQGDNIDITSTNTKLWPVWMDNSSGLYQIWTAPLDFSSINSIADKNELNQTQSIDRIYPNPSHGNVIIEFSVKSEGLVSLKLFDLYGNVLLSPFSGYKKPETYEITVDLSENSLRPGILLWQLKVGDQTDQKRMIYLP